MSRRLALIPLRPRYWDVVKDGCGITRKQYDLYYQDQEIAIAYRLGNVYDYPTSLWMLPAPQGYRYLGKRCIINSDARPDAPAWCMPPVDVRIEITEKLS